jgi:UDP-N-acetylglucosamine 4,6-dehydratase
MHRSPALVPQSPTGNPVMLRGSSVVITGGTGSFGQTMARRLLEAECREIRIFSRDEAKQDAMRSTFPSDTPLRFFVGDVRDAQSVARVMRGTDLVFHAAALKQVPSCEFFPIEAVRTNVLGSSHVIRAAVEAGVRSVVCLSTDKAVEPVNAMGMTKGLMEKVAVAEARALGEGHTTVSTVRYGNVLYSRGSVVPVFLRQALAGHDLTVTDPRMTRFMMNLDTAVSLVEYAFGNARQGDLFIQKAPAAAMCDVARVVAALVGSVSKTRLIGIRHGEKLHEVLASSAEVRRAEDLGEYLRIPMDDRDLDYAKYFVDGEVDDGQTVDFTSENAHRMDDVEIEKMLLTVPEIQAAVAGRGPA